MKTTEVHVIESQKQRDTFNKLLAGDATVTFFNEKSGNRYTYKIQVNKGYALWNLL